MSRVQGTESFSDPKASLKFYQEILGMELLDQHSGGDFTLYFLAFPQKGDENLSAEEKAKNRFNREGILELTHNHGTEDDPDFKGYASGNSDPGRGFGHIAISVDNIEEACERFEKMGVQFKKKLTDGKMKHIAFILDCDGYWIEVVPKKLSL
ncbi:hypothetical protein QFC20_002905 [Naganishia adeliensis]|uniref:Uncharacterized protein n=1 Tax=Naganishia adeliensis TaxID=92952 RepID=A0ACC2WIC6_9TREE|nr:hypothetical protein QFC20_002905 [Naganishia adeliensis]